jgi:hypothetical protein
MPTERGRHHRAELGSDGRPLAMIIVDTTVASELMKPSFASD